jgi:Fur family ferric uptake transcriptional regulator
MRAGSVGSEGPLRTTSQRRVILEELRKMRSHPTADELYERVRRRLPRISLGTVYRNLETMSSRGVICKLEPGGRQKRFDGTCREHCHVRCLACGRVDDIPGERPASVVSAIRRTLGYEIVGHRLELVGYCPVCRRRRRSR